jgi:hypothetical protein
VKETLAGLERTESELQEQVHQKQEEQKKMAEQDDILYKKLRDNHRYLNIQINLYPLLIECWLNKEKRIEA